MPRIPVSLRYPIKEMEFTVTFTGEDGKKLIYKTSQPEGWSLNTSEFRTEITISGYKWQVEGEEA